ncbi:MAG: DUF3090 family protein [Candidatus Dormiibacterota bacterium]
MTDHLDFDPAISFGVGTIGEPGERQFFLRAQGDDRTVLLACEKVHVQGLAVRIRQLLAEQGIEFDLPAARPPAPAAAGELDWRVGELGLGYHEKKGRFVVVVRESPEAEDAEGATGRFWLTRAQVRTFLDQAESVLSSGRPTCPYCGLPIDPSGHPCPAANGSRPVF